MLLKKARIMCICAILQIDKRLSCILLQHCDRSHETTVFWSVRNEKSGSINTRKVSRSDDCREYWYSKRFLQQLPIQKIYEAIT